VCRSKSGTGVQCDSGRGPYAEWRYTKSVENTVSTPVADLSASPLPWQLELRRVSTQLAASDPQKLTVEELQREARDVSPGWPEETLRP
jgi:hypothetical protein